MEVFERGGDESGLQSQLRARNVWSGDYGHAWIALKRYTAPPGEMAHTERFTAFVKSVGQPLERDVLRNMATGFVYPTADFRARTRRALWYGLALEDGIMEEEPDPEATIDQFLNDIAAFLGPLERAYSNERVLSENSSSWFCLVDIPYISFELSWFLVGEHGCGLIMIFGND